MVRRRVQRPLVVTHLSTGFTAIKALIELHLRTTQRQWEPLVFQFDSGTNVTALSMTAVKALSLPVSRRVVELEVRTANTTVRQPIHPSHLTVRIPGFEGREFYWPCHVIDQPDVPPQPLLGLTGVLNDLLVILGGRYALEAPYGWLTLEELTP